jgi:hypothetical protein
VSARTRVSLVDGHYITVTGEVDEVASTLNSGSTLNAFVSGGAKVWINADHVLHLRPEIYESQPAETNRAA